MLIFPNYPFDWFLRKFYRITTLKPKTSKMTKENKPINSVAVLTLATGKYQRYIEGFVKSVNRYFLKDKTINIFIFTDAVTKLTIKDNVHLIPTPHRPWPASTMSRFEYFIESYFLFEEADAIYFLDADMEPQVLLNDDILPSDDKNLVAVRHPGFFVSGGGTYEPRRQSQCYIEPGKEFVYCQGCFWGGRTDNILQLFTKCKDMIDIDTRNGIIPVFHDETAILAYFSKYEQPKVLSPNYAFPENGRLRFQLGDLEEKIRHLDKNHNSMRDTNERT